MVMNEIIINGKNFTLLAVKEVNDVIIAAIGEFEEYRNELIKAERCLSEKEIELLISFDNDITNEAAKKFAKQGIEKSMSSNLKLAILTRILNLKKYLDGFELHDLIVIDHRVEIVDDILSLFLTTQYYKNSLLPDSVRLIPFCDFYREL